MVTLREASMADAAVLYEWANDPDARAASFSTDPIPWATHVAWLQRVLADPGRRLWVAEQDGQPVGVVRLDGDTISLTVAPVARGRRLASPIIAAACREASGKVVARIRPENTRSRRAFAAAGFVEVGDGDEVEMVWP